MRDKNKVQWCQKTTYSQKNAGQLHTEGVCVCVRVWKCVCESLCVCVHVSRPRSDEMHCQPSPNPSQVAFTSAVSPLPSPSPSPLPSQQSRCSTQPVSVSWMGSALRCSWLHEWIAMAPSPATAPHRSNYCNYYEIMQNAYAISRRDPLPPPPVWAAAKAGAGVCCLLSPSASQSLSQRGVWVMGQLVWLDWEQVHEPESHCK